MEERLLADEDGVGLQDSVVNCLAIASSKLAWAIW